MAKSTTQSKKKAAPARPSGHPQRQVLRVGRNETCPCGSGKKYKLCHESEGQAFLSKLTYDQQRKEKVQQLKDKGVPWYRRLFVEP